MAALLAASAGPAFGQGAAGPRQIPSGVLNASGNPNSRVPMAPADSMIQVAVERLDFDSYKELIRGLAQFGDRQQGTEGNVHASEWIEAQL